MRRMLLASALSVLLLTSLWLQFILVGGSLVSPLAGWGILCGIDIIEITYFLVSYILIRQKKEQSYIHAIRSYWLVETLFLCTTTFMSNNTVCIMVQILIFVAGVCLIPIMPTPEQIGCEAVEVIAVIAHVLIGNIDWERALYACVIIVFGNVVAHQNYYSYTRRLLENDKLTNAKRQAETDQMTELLNRRGFEHRISAVWPFCNRQGLEVAVVMVDIDNFKKYNDTFGHGAGDNCIQQVAAVIRKHARRSSDFAARVGGEEFLVFLAGISETDAMQWAMGCKKEVEDLEIPHADTNFLPFVSVSMGVCHWDLDNYKREFFELRAEADRSLYQAKEAGRACIFMNNQMYAKTFRSRWKERT
ncbi:diguanylate cyclase (GGDEF) domain-containing protein [Lachnospiraceae bacterium XBB1006]|nr:diguanylate cyclase (GGDEF) domain-containing protein [Lachnospiraceae bacterium XBB1006]